MLKNLNSLLHKIRFRWQHSDLSRQALLDDLELQRLQQYARSSYTSPLTALRDVQQLLLGERLSTYTGSGYEFAENRLFQAGDDARFINWRVYARTGEMYRKVFHEERRPQLWLVVDRRNSMRFATRMRLKVTAAVRQALVHLYQAQQQQIAVGAIILDKPPQWFEAKSSAVAQHNLIKSLNQACPPLNDVLDDVSIDKVIRQLHSRLQAGSIIVLLSDFHDLQQDHIAHLHHLTQHHTVIAVQILDDIEIQLPKSGHFRITDSDNSNPMLLNCDDTITRNALEEQLLLRQQQTEQWLTRAGIHYQLLMTSDEPFILSREQERGIA